MPFVHPFFFPYPLTRTVLLSILLCGVAGAQEAAPLTCAQIVDKMQARSAAQSEHLEHYTATRHYAVEYRGFARVIDADMDATVDYQAGAGKTFNILGAHGSRLLIDKVLREALASEREASRNPAATALSPANYQFRLAGEETLGPRPAYVLEVEPIKPSKFLYRGKVWVDREQFAVLKVDAEPARNPSFWISHVSIRYTNAETDGFWLPEHNQSETKVRIGGTATLTIDYGTYRITSK